MQRAADRRIFIIRIVILVWAMAIMAQLVRLQVTKHSELLARAERQQQAVIDLSPRRGIIYDRNGNELGRSVGVKSLYASTAAIRDPAPVAEQLATVLNIEAETLLRRLTSEQVFVAVKRKLSDKEAREVEALGIPGLQFIEEMKRFYVGGSAAQAIGFVDIDEHGKGGVELHYDSLIRGKGGRLLLNRDALNNYYGRVVEEPVAGASVWLTIDSLVQHYVEKALVQAVRATRAAGGTIVVLRPATGEVLAVANYPSFDPNNLSDSTEEGRRNRAVEVAFEPGSIFKIVTYSAALEEGLIEPDTRIDCRGGSIQVAGRMVRDSTNGVLTATQALAKSSNVAAIKIGLELGPERLARYVEQFGFGSKTGIELPAESRGLFREPGQWEPTTIGSIPMGHEIGITAVQAAAAVACIANGGEWVRPYLVEKVTSSDGRVLEEHRRESRRVVGEDTSRDLTRMLEVVVLKGTGKRAKIAGYRAAGKTGTAQKIDPSTGRYSKSAYVASFAGFAPTNNPEIACVVALDEPKALHQGGESAAPLFARVVAETLSLLGVPREEEVGDAFAADSVRAYEVPRWLVEDRDYEVAIPATEPAGFEPSIDAIDEVPGGPATVVVPDLTGCGIRQAAALCSERGLKIKAAGQGKVATQDPPAGTLVAPKTICRVTLSRQVAHKNGHSQGRVASGANGSESN